MDKKNLVKRVVEKVAGKMYVDKVLEKQIKKLSDNLKGMLDEKEIKDNLGEFFNLRDMNTEKQAYVIITLVQVHDLQLKSLVHKKVLKDLAKKNRFVNIMF